MITKYTKETIKQAIEDEDFMYEYTTHISDKLRAIYNLFGWTHMLKDFNEAQNTIDSLMMSIFKYLLSGLDDIKVSTAGITIEGWFDLDGQLNLDYYFNLD